MKYRQLGASELEVSEISLGSWLTYGVGVEQERALACLNQAFDVGINFIDTANVYGRGAAETFLGGALAGRPRDSFVLATKAFFPMSDTDRGLSRRRWKSSSRRRCGGCGPTTSISTNATATTITRRWRRRWRR
jgi:aryl-alcohol dehydrogenase-like predicted oxidoreductase